MSLGRKTHDGVITGRSARLAERRNTVPGKNKASINASPTATKKYSRYVENIVDEESDKDRYLITYADLITLLLGLFIILYAVSNIDLAKYQKFMSAFGSTFGGSENIKMTENGLKEIKGSVDLKSNVQDVISNYGYKDLLQVEENERGVTIHILQDLLFNSGESEIKGSSVIVLQRLAAILKNIPNDIRIEGHTDNVPINSMMYESNWHLSVSRALNTAYHLISKEHLPADKVSIVGYAEYKPVANNETEDGRKLNRRVDIVIIKKQI